MLFAYLLTIFPLFFPGQANILSRLPAPVLAVYQIGFDRPWIAIAAFTAFAGAFLIRNYLAFKSTELAPQWGKPTA